MHQRTTCDDILKKEAQKTQMRVKQFITTENSKFLSGKGDEKQVAAGVLRDAGTAMGKRKQESQENFTQGQLHWKLQETPRPEPTGRA